MNHVVQFSIAQLVGFILAAAAGITTIAAAWTWVAKAIKHMKSPNDTQNARLTELEKRVARHDELFTNDKRRIEAIEDGTRVTQQALLALLDHGIVGNNLDQMEAAKRDLERYLIER